MEQSLLLAILAAVLLVLAGVLLLLFAAAGLLWIRARREAEDLWDREAAIAQMPARDPAWTPTPILRLATPPRPPPREADEAGTELMTAAHLGDVAAAASTGATEVRAALEGELALEDTEETTTVGPRPRV